MLLILRAERMAVVAKETFQETRKAFDEAILASGKIGMLHLSALANERAGIFCRNQANSEWALTYLGRARELYGEWDAIAKVKQMDNVYRDVLEPSASEGETSASTGLHAKPRFGSFLMEHYRSLRV